MYATARLCAASLEWTQDSKGYVGVAQGYHGSYRAAAAAQKLRRYLEKKEAYTRCLEPGGVFRTTVTMYISIALVRTVCDDAR